MTTIKAVHTSDLGMFKKSPTNRDTNNPESQNRIKRIASSMMDEGLLLNPIIVTSKFFVIDGCHRLEAAKIAGKGLYYIVDNTISNTPQGLFNAIKKVNINSKEWGKKDYLKGYSDKGLEAYKELTDFGKKYPMFSMTEQLMFLNNSGTKHSGKLEFANGQYTVQRDHLNISEIWAQRLLQIKPYFEEHYNKSVFVRALLTIMEKSPSFNFDSFMRRVRSNPQLLKVQDDKKGYAKMIERIYNQGRVNKQSLPVSATG